MPVRPFPLVLAATFLLGTLSPAGAQSGAPPDRVGRIAAVTGSVSFHLAGATDWQVASRNLPVTSGTALWVAPGGEAAIGVTGNRIVLAPSTELDVDRLDDQALAATQPQGESYWHLSVVAAAETYSLTTPRGTVTIASAGRYEIVSGDTEHPTTVTVLEGAATLTGIPTTAEVGANQTLTVIGDGGATPFTASIGPAVQDDFLKHVLAEETPPRPRPAAAPAILGAMTGAEALADVGSWAENAEYGPVWYPPAADYVPYRQGRWAYVSPWGWTWVDDAPWGFAPSHYGRWSQFDGRWGWVPGRDWEPGRPPVYAPALVGFIGGAALGAALGSRVGWAPLGPRDAYRPSYFANDRMLQGLNRPTGAALGTSVTINNRTAITIVPTQVFTNSASVAGAVRPGPAPAIGAQAFQFRPQVAPTRATIGATRAVLQQINPAGLSAPAAHVGPGPELNRAGSGGPRPGAGAGPMPQIGPAAIVGGAAAGAVAGSLLRQPGPQAGLPALRERGAPPPSLRPGPNGNPGTFAGSRPPNAPGLLDPGAGPGHRGGDFPDRGPERLALPGQGGGRPMGESPGFAARPEAPGRPALPRVQYGIPPGQEAPARTGAQPSNQGGPPRFARPEGGRPEFPRPEGGRPEFARPARPEFARPEGGRPDGGRPEGARPEFARPQIPHPEVAAPQFAPHQAAPPPMQVQHAPPPMRPEQPAGHPQGGPPPHHEGRPERP